MISFIDNITVAKQTILNSFENQNKIVIQGNQDGTKSHYSIINENILITGNVFIIKFISSFFDKSSILRKCQ